MCDTAPTYWVLLLLRWHPETFVLVLSIPQHLFLDCLQSLLPILLLKWLAFPLELFLALLLFENGVKPSTGISVLLFLKVKLV